MIVDVFYRDEFLVGRLAEQPGTGKIFFRYEAEWLKKRIELSPIHLPLEWGLQLAGHHERYAFQGLFGLFADSLPLGWGRKLLDRRLVNAGIHPQKAGVLVRLSFLGDRAMGALSFRPDADECAAKVLDSISLAQADHDARRFVEGRASNGLEALIAAGTSPGGARPKVLALVREDVVRLDAGVEPGWEPWLIKLSEGDFSEAGRIEFAYSKMAEAAGLTVPPTRLFDGRFFGTKRFDRQGTEKLHVHSLGGLLHAADGSYEDLASTVLQLSGDQRDMKEVIRRIAFNVGALVRDDHMLNVAFIMDSAGRWSLAPSYDLTPNDLARLPAIHAMSVNGQERPRARDILAVAEEFGVEGARDLIDGVRQAIDRWRKFAELAGVADEATRMVQKELALGLEALRPASLPRRPSISP